MIAANNHKNGRNLFSFFRRGKSIEVTEITGYRVGDLSEDKPVVIAAGATMLGHLFAPEITVAGLLCGSAVTRQLSVQASGQVWGDVFVGRVQVEAGGRIQGWVSSLDDTSYQRWREAGELPTAVANPESFALTDDLLEKSLPLRNAAQLTALQHLQTQAAVSLAARNEMEQAFQQRVLEMAGETTTRVQSLLATIQETQYTLNNLQRETAATEKRLQTREKQVEQQTNELQVTHDLLEKQKEQLSQLGQLSEEQQQQIEQLTSKRNHLETSLRENSTQLEQTTERARSLEVALQTNLQHSAEQEQSLVRWQELAEVTEKRSIKLESDLKAAQMELQQSADMMSMLRDQRAAVEKEWEKTLAELENTRHKETRPLTIHESVEMIDRISKLEADLFEMTQSAQESQDQLNWHRASLESSQLELDRTRHQLAEHGKQVEQLQRDMNTRQALVDKWQSEAQKLRAKVNEQEQHLKKLRNSASEMRQQASNEINALRDSLRQSRHSLEALQQEKEQSQKKQQNQFEQLQQHVTAEKSTAQESLRQTKLQLEAAEAEINHLRQQIGEQSNRLAEIHANLIEKELLVEQAKNKVLQQQALMKKMRETAETTIKRLNEQLQQTTVR